MAEVAALFRERDLAAWNSLLSPVDCCYQAVLSPAEVLTDPQVLARRLVRQVGAPPQSIEVLLPVWRDGQAPSPREPLSEIDLESALSHWGAS